MHPLSHPGEPRPSIMFSTDPRSGRTVVAVSILHSQDAATLFVEDYAAIVNVHGHCNFYRNKSRRHAGHVLIKSKRDKRVRVVARLIMGDRAGSMVEVADGDLANLRRSNLYYRKGGTGGTRTSRRKAPAESTGGGFGAAAGLSLNPRKPAQRLPKGSKSYRS